MESRLLFIKILDYGGTAPLDLSMALKDIQCVESALDTTSEQDHSYWLLRLVNQIASIYNFLNICKDSMQALLLFIIYIYLQP